MWNDAARFPVRRLALARVLSGAGTQVAAIALSYQVYARTESARWLGFTLFLTLGLPGLLGPWVGVLVDRVDRRRLMIASDVIGAVIWVSMISIRDPATLIALACLGGLVAQPFVLAASASIPNLVAEADLEWANSWVEGAGSIARLAGPALGGALFALGGPGLAFTVNAFSYVCSALLVTSIRGRAFSGSADRVRTRSSGIFDGFKAVAADRGLLALGVLWLLMTPSLTITLVADLPLARSMGVSSVGYGLIDSFFGGGALLGAIAAGRLKGSRERKWIVLSTLGVAGAWLVMVGAPWFELVLCAAAIAGLFDSIMSVAGMTAAQRHAPDAIRGRVLGTLFSMGMVANAAGFLAVGPLVAAVGPRPAYGVGAALSVVAACLFFVIYPRE